jgi:hypothetical protein
MKQILFTVLLIVGVGIRPDARAADNPCKPPPGREFSDDMPRKFNSTNVTVAIHKGHAGAPIEVGFNDVDKPVALFCHSTNGCVLGVISVVQSTFNSYVCTYVDDIAMSPEPQNIVFTAVPTLQSRKVGPGKHFVQTKGYALNAGTLGPWEANYTLYDN